MNRKFEDIFESINLLHKKYSSKEYLETLENFNNSSNELVQILEKYKISENDIKKTSQKKTNKKVKLIKNAKKLYTKNKPNYQNMQVV